MRYDRRSFTGNRLPVPFEPNGCVEYLVFVDGILLAPWEHEEVCDFFEPSVDEKQHFTAFIFFASLVEDVVVTIITLENPDEWAMSSRTEWDNQCDKDQKRWDKDLLEYVDK